MMMKKKLTDKTNKKETKKEMQKPGVDDNFFLEEKYFISEHSLLNSKSSIVFFPSLTFHSAKKAESVNKEKLKWETKSPTGSQTTGVCAYEGF